MNDGQYTQLVGKGQVVMVTKSKDGDLLGLLCKLFLEVFDQVGLELRQTGLVFGVLHCKLSFSLNTCTHTRGESRWDQR